MSQLSESSDESVVNDEKEDTKIDVGNVSDDIIEKIFTENWDVKQSFRDECQIIEKYDINENIKAEILDHPDTEEYVYYINEPVLSEREEEIRYKVIQDIEDEIKSMDISDLEREEVSDLIMERAEGYVDSHESIWNTYGNQVLQALIGEDYDNILSEYIENYEKYRPGTSVDDETKDKILYYIKRDLVDFERLTPLFNDKYIEDISCNGPEIPVFVFHNKYNDLITNLVYDTRELDLTVSSLAQRADEHISIANPNVAGRLEGGYRMQLTLSDEISPKGSNFTIRKFKDEPFTPIDLIEFGTFSIKQMAYLWLSIENGHSLIFAGGTASGKTTSMNAVSLFIPPRAKVITIEDTQEIVLQHTNWVQTITRTSFGDDDSGEIDMYELLRDALRQRPEYIIVGEIRGKEAQTLFQAMNTGHTTYSTMHAESVESVINRLEHEPINLPRQMLNALDIVSVQTTIEIDGETERRCKEMVEIEGVNVEDDSVKTRGVFEYNRGKDEIEERIRSQLLEEIKRELNYSEEKLNREIEDRKKVLRLMMESDQQYDYRDVTDIIKKYNSEPEEVLDEIQ